MTQINQHPPATDAQQNQMQTLTAYARDRLDALETRALRRTLKPTARKQGAQASRDDGALISFSDNDYLGLSAHPAVIEAGARAARDYGAGAGASRLITGDNPLNRQVEDKLAAIKGTQSALVFGSGYLANIGVIPALVSAGDLIVLDSLSHSCIHAGARLSGARIAAFRHNDVDDARAKLREHAPYGRALVITETIFSMDGDAAPLDALYDVCTEHEAWLVTDDAHGLGVVEMSNPAPIQLGTLSKAVGVYGGYACGPRPLTDMLVNRARSFVYTTGLPPFVLGAAAAALDIIAADPGLGEKTMANAHLFCSLMNLPAPQSAIVPLVMGDARAALALSQKMQQHGFLVTAIRPPTVPEGTARLRFAFSAAHQHADIKRLAACLAAALKDAA